MRISNPLVKAIGNGLLFGVALAVFGTALIVLWATYTFGLLFIASAPARLGLASVTTVGSIHGEEDVQLVGAVGLGIFVITFVYYMRSRHKRLSSSEGIVGRSNMASDLQGCVLAVILNLLFGIAYLLCAAGVLLCIYATPGANTISPDRAVRIAIYGGFLLQAGLMAAAITTWVKGFGGGV